MTNKPQINVTTYTGGIIGPSIQMLGPVPSGARIVAGTPPGCWGPMITPRFKGGHEVSQPVAVEGAMPGDAIAIKLKSLTITSEATSSGVMEFVDGRYISDPFVAKKCSGCGSHSPESHLEGIGDEAVRCSVCGAEVNAFRFRHGYAIAIDAENNISVTLDRPAAEQLAVGAEQASALPNASQQHSILSLARADMPGVVARVQPFLGNIGTVPSTDMPDSHNCGDFGGFLVGAEHDYALTQDALNTHKTDGHMDTNSVRAGAILICPVKVPGGGVYMGDMHAQQGNGELAGHATDVSGITEVEVELIKGLQIDGPILLQREEDLPLMARPFAAKEMAKGQALASRHGLNHLEQSWPISFIGTGQSLNDATDNATSRAAAVTGLSYDEILNRATITGSVEISRLPGCVRLTFLCPEANLQKLGIMSLIKEQYAI